MTFHQIHTGKDFYKYSFFRGMPSLKMLQLLQVLRSSKQQLESCSIPTLDSILLVFNLFLDAFNEPPLTHGLCTVSFTMYWSILDICFYFPFIVDLFFNLSS